jgi:hypothetical protein
MQRGKRGALGVLAAGAIAGAALFTAVGSAGPPGGPTLTPVPAPNAKAPGVAPASKLSPELTQVVVAQGSNRLENPSGGISTYGYDDDMLATGGEPQMLPTPASPTEAHKTEPDKNVYLVLRDGLKGADPNYDYGTHFLFQGHEAGTPGYLTRINLDADAAHRVTLLGTKDTDGKDLPDFDGVTWNPWAERLLFTSEGSLGGGVWSADLAVPATIENLSGSLGQGGYEGIQNDADGNVWIVEDSGGANKPSTVARRPNSFVFRFVPTTPGDLRHGKLEALQVLNTAGDPITFASQAAVDAPDQVLLHTYGHTLRTQWVTVHDTAVDGSTPYNANALAKAADATPFKRPENGLFRPDGKFRDFFFDETGDTNVASVENTTAGGWGAVQKLTQSGPSADTGTLSLFYKADGPHSGIDNVAFLSRNAISFVQDASDGVHTSLGFDSGFVWDVTVDYSNPANQPVRWLAQGRDPSATLDAANAGFGKNDQDNEITGIHVSNGDPDRNGILGAKAPDLERGNGNWRWFYTQQHGDNVTYEVLLDDRQDR